MSSGKDRPESDSSQHRLGECLQAAGLLNSEQLDEAIEYQCIYGGKLGTSLIELGLIDENQLARILSKQLGQHYIKPDFLMDIPTSVLSIIPEKIALKYQVIPYHEDGKKLFVAMNESKNLTIIDELSFQLDRIIIPMAIPEIRLMLALKKHYGMLIAPRYESLARQIDRRTRAAEKFSIKNNRGNTPVNSDEGTPSAEKNQSSILNLLKKLANAQNRDDIAQAILNYLKVDFPSCALFMIHEGVANGWLSTLENKKEPFEQITIPLSEPSIFNLVTTNRTHYLGPMTDSPQNRKILDYFNAKPPQDVMIIPLMVQNRIVSILYIQGQIEDLTKRLVDFKNLTEKIDLSFKLLILKNKILIN